MNDRNLQASWIGHCEPNYSREDSSEKEFSLKFNLIGKISIMARNEEEAIDKVAFKDYKDLLKYIIDIINIEVVED